jgi:magnesium transporter
MEYDMTLALEFLKAHPSDAALVLEEIPIHHTASFMENIPADIAANVIGSMDPLTTIGCLEHMKPDTISAITENLSLEIASMILRRMDSILKDSVMTSLPSEILEPLTLMLRFPEGTAGALMDPRCFVLPQDIHVKEAMRRVRDHLRQDSSYIYVVNRDHVLLGFVRIHEMLHLDPDTLISTIIHTDIWKLSAHSDRQAILMNPGWREFHTLPVTDKEGIFLGVIDYQTIRRLEQDTIKPLHRNPQKETTAAMGELFWIGLSGLLKGAASAICSTEERG